MTIDIQQIAGWITTLGIIAGAFITVYKIIDKHLLKRIAAVEKDVAATKKEVSDVKKWTAKQQEDIVDGAKCGSIIINGVLACLYGLQEKGCNGEVTKAIGSIKGYVNSKAYKTVSQQSD